MIWKISFLLLLASLALCHCQQSTTQPQAAAADGATTNATKHTSSPASSSSSGSASASASTTSRAAVYEAYAIQFLNNGIRRMQHVYNRKRELYLDLIKNLNYNSKSQITGKQQIDEEYHELVHELAANLSVIPVKYLRNPTLRRQVQRLSKLQLYGLKKQEFDQAKRLLNRLQSYVTSPPPCEQTETNDPICAKAMVPDIVNMIKKVHNDDYEILLYYWHKWRQLLNQDDRAKTTFIEYVRMFRKASEYNGHVTPSRTWYLYFDTENFQRELEDVIWEIMPLYRELHAYLRHWARHAYGAGLTAETTGAIPAPVMEQMLHQDWYKHTVFKMPYSDSKDRIPTVNERLHEVYGTSVKIIDKASQFYESMGFDKLPSNIISRIPDNMGECRSEIYYFPPTVALRYCAKLDYKVLLQMHGHISELQYNIFQTDLPFGLDEEPCPGFGSAMGEAAVVASGTPRHLHTLALLSEDTLGPRKSLNRLFRMGIHTLLAIPQYFINDRYLVDVMDGRVDPNEFNCAYWQLQYKYAGVKPPDRRNERHFDPDYKFYKGLHPVKSNTVKFMSEVLGFQFYRSFCLMSGQYKPGNSSYPLHNCDFNGSKKVGDILKKMMKMGATKHWRDVMEVAADERRLSGRGVIEYFAPLYVWLKETNKKMGLITGWDDDIQCTQ